jgi:hypothetical protein
MFTFFYVAAEMWGDVVLSLLFWGLANETTTIREAPLLYPLFGIGANIGQTVSGKALSFFAGWAGPRLSYSTQLQVTALLAAVLCQPSAALILPIPARGLQSKGHALHWRLMHSCHECKYVSSTPDVLGQVCIWCS